MTNRAHNKIYLFPYRPVYTVLMLVILSGGMVTPLMVDDGLHDPVRMGKIFFFAGWMTAFIPVGVVAFILSWKQPLDKLSLFVLAWFAWIISWSRLRLHILLPAMAVTEKRCWPEVYVGLKATGEYMKAEEQYQLAAYTVPHKFYPLYLLAKLYEETGQNEKAVTIAREIMDKTVKIPSQAIEEIREEMQEILDKDIKPSATTRKNRKKGEHCTNDGLPLIKQQFW